MQFSAVLLNERYIWDLEISGKAKTNNAGKSRGVTKRKKNVPGRVEDVPNEKKMCQEG